MKKAAFILTVVALCEAVLLAVLLGNHFRFSPTTTKFVMFDRKTGQSCWSGLDMENPISNDGEKVVYDALDKALQDGKTPEEAGHLATTRRRDFSLPLCKDLVR